MQTRHCPGCELKFKSKARPIPEKGMSITCPRCGHRWAVVPLPKSSQR